MIDSTARAERLDLQSSEPAAYIWEVAQKPVVVRLLFPLIDRLESEAVETFRSLSSRGSEIGGLLLGSASPGSPSTVTVADYELIACDYSRGPLYRLSEADMGRYEQAIEKYSSGNGPRVIGYFRSHTRKGLTLDAEDLAFFEPRFLEPHHIALLIRPFATKASTAGIFIRENGRIAGETSFLEFPFRTAELTGTRNSGEKSEPASATSAGNAAAAKPQSRAQIVPIASRRETAMPEPVAAAQPAVPIVAERVEVPVAPPKAPKSEAAVPVIDPVIDKVVAPPPPVAKVVEPAVKPKAKVAPVLELPPVPNKNKKLRLVVAAAVCMLVLVGGALVVFPALQNRGARRAAVTQQDSSLLTLRVERTPGGLLLTWNRDSQAIQNAAKVTLAITDGDRHENIQMDPNQVRTGSIVYPPITGDVSFQMEVIDSHQTKTTSESLRVLDPRPSPLATPSDTVGQVGAKPGVPGKPVVNGPSVPENSVVEEVKPQEETPAPKVSAPLKPFNTETLAQRLRPVTSSDLPDAPVLSRAGGPLSGNLPGIVTSPQVAPPPPTKAAPAAPVTTTATPAPVQGGQLQKAVVISKKEPEYPRLARQSGASGLVEVEATIGLDGRVKNAHVLRGNPMLQKAALDAVMEWRYKPATLNGQPVESPVEIRLNFMPGHN